jgi:putative hydrolase of the HAD superfamily
VEMPRMILFDYGQTLLDERRFDGIAGTGAVLKYATSNPEHKTAEQLQAFANELNDDIGRYRPELRRQYQFEIHNHQFQKYLYEYWDIEFELSPFEIEKVFWDNAAPAVKTKHIDDLLDCLGGLNIRTGVVSNISFSGDALTDRINCSFPRNKFEFILATSEYVFRKPHRRIFELALSKAKLKPEEVWYCGDNVMCDIDGAAGSGIFPVWYTGASENYAVLPLGEYLKIEDWSLLVKKLQQSK